MAHSPRVLCIAGSPRRHGASELLLDAAIHGIEGAGGAVDKLVVAEAGITACQGCNACSRTGVCRLDDPMTGIYARLESADAVLVSSPVFFASVPAVLKALYDRCQPYWARVYVLGRPRPARRPAGLLLVRGGGDPYGFEGAALSTRSVYAVLGLDMIDEVLIDDVDTPDELRKRPEALEAARALGTRLVGESNARRIGR